MNITELTVLNKQAPVKLHSCSMFPPYAPACDFGSHDNAACQRSTTWVLSTDGGGGA